MAELVDWDVESHGSVLYNDRPMDAVRGGQALWPQMERRRAPRRVEDALAGALGRKDSGDRREQSSPIPMQVAQKSPLVNVAGKAVPDRDRHIRGYRHAVLCIDVLAAVTGATVAFLLRFGATPHSSDALYWWGSLLLPILWVAGIAVGRAYETRFLASSAEEYRRVMNSALGLIAVIAFVSYVSKTEFARGYVVAALPLSAGLSLVGRYVARRSLRRRRARGVCLQDVVVVGHEWAVLDLVAALRRTPDAGLRVVGACLPGGRGSRQMAELDIPVLGDLTQVVAAVRSTGADALAVTTCVEFGGPELRQVCWALENSDVEILVAPALIEVTGPRLHIRPVSGLPLLHVEKPEFTGSRRVAKGLFDRSVALAALMALSPVMLAIAVAVRINSKGPAFFRQTRVGVRGESFTVLKFRSMHTDAESRLAALHDQNERKEGLLFKIKDDPRVTSVGKWLRRYSLDELPQLINVLRGDMSLVGPRPPLPGEVAQYGDDVRRRLLVRPGVTGLWQVSGRSDLTWEESVRLDLRYVENWSLIFDFQILWQTASAVLRGSGAY
jgi:exopolysaccharide biosynthesis polyprenyl glycosylphosphotransferase